MGEAVHRSAYSVQVAVAHQTRHSMLVGEEPVSADHLARHTTLTGEEAVAARHLARHEIRIGAEINHLARYRLTMSSPLAELAALLTRDQPVTGVVVSLTGSTARIATANGMVQAKAENGITVGARVRVVDGVARAAITPTGTYTV